MSKGRISVDRIVEAGLEGKEGLVSGFEYPGEQLPADRFELMAAMIQRVLPSRSMARGRRFTAGYRRFVVLVWMVYPDAFGSSTIRDLSDELGISESGIYKIRDDLLAGMEADV